MKDARVCLVAALLCFVPSAGFAEQEVSGQSPGGHVGYELRTGRDEAKELWVWRDSEKQRAVKLCNTPGWGNMKLHFSPDDRWIIVQDGGASLGISLRLFHRAGEVAYEERKDANLDGKAERAALQQSGREAKEVSDHRYAECLDWSPDSDNVLIRVSGKGGDQYGHIEFHWLGVYNLTNGKFSSDLGKMNKFGVTQTPPSGR